MGGGSVDVSLAFLHDSCFCFTSRSASLTTHGAQQMMRNLRRAFDTQWDGFEEESKAAKHSKEREDACACVCAHAFA